MKKVYPILILAFLRSLLFSQTTGAIKGSLSDAQTREAIAFSDVILQQEMKDSTKTMARAITDTEGHFLFKHLPEGNYTVYCSYPGYILQYIKRIAVKKDDVSNISLKLHYEQENITQETLIYIPPGINKEGQKITREEYINICGSRPVE